MRSAIPPAARTLGAARLRGTDVPALLLDYNGTLADDEALQARIWVETFAARGIRYGEDAYFARHVGLADPDVVAAVAPHLGPDARAEAITERRRRYVEAAWEARPVTEGAVALLARLDHEGVPWCIVSAATRVEIEAGLRAAGLEHRGVGIVAVDDVCRPKPDPLAYRLALTRLGRSAAEAWAVEDSRTGITAARAAGLRVVGVGTSLPSAVLADLADVVSSVDATLLDMVKEADAADHAARLARKVRP